MAYLTRDDSGLIQLWQNYPNYVDGIWQAWVERGVNNEVGLDVTEVACFRDIFKGRKNTKEPLTLIITTFTERKYYTAEEASYRADMADKAEIMEQLNDIYDKLDKATNEGRRSVFIYHPILKGVENILTKKGYTVTKTAVDDSDYQSSITVNIQYNNPKSPIEEKDEVITNLNTYVYVTLTKAGATFINQKNADICTYAKAPLLKTDYKEGDQYKGMLWEMLRIFGETMYIGADLPFNSIKFENNKR